MSDRREEEYDREQEECFEQVKDYDYEQDEPESEDARLNWAGYLEDYDDGGFASWENSIVRKVIR